LSKLGLHQGEQEGEGKLFLKSKPEPKEPEQQGKLAIGFQSN
jgi:hypothetical protein